MNVFSNFYLMRDICGLNCKLNNNACARAELWDVLKLRIQPDQCINWLVFSKCAETGNIKFMEWVTENRVQGWPSVIRTEALCERFVGWENVISTAAFYGKFDMVKWLFANCPEDTCDYLE